MFIRVGHRGAAAYETENTLASFQKAIELGVDAIEFDVRVTKDDKLAVIHDDNLKRVFGADAAVGQTSFAELKGLTGGRLVSLDEALKFIDGRVERLVVELKETGNEERVLEALRKEGMEKKSVIVSFREAALARVKELDRSILTGLIYARHKTPIAAALELEASYLLPLYRFVHTRDVEKAHANGLKVVVWTINTRKEALQYRAKGVDGIASDKPDVLDS